MEWLPIYVATAVAAAVLGHHGLVAAASVLYFFGKIVYSLGYGTGHPSSRILGLFLSETLALGIVKGAILLDLYGHYVTNF